MWVSEGKVVALGSDAATKVVGSVMWGVLCGAVRVRSRR